MNYTGDSAEAVKWFHKVAEKGVSAGEFELGRAYFQGNGVSQDSTEVAKWFLKAAARGHVSAQFNIGMMYLQGNGVLEDYSEAVKWLRKAAGRGDTSAQGMLGSVCIEGLGVSQDYITAYMWLTLCIDRSTNSQSQILEKAKSWRELITDRMTEQQIEEAKRMASKWKPDRVSELVRVPARSQVPKLISRPTAESIKESISVKRVSFPLNFSPRDIAAG